MTDEIDRAQELNLKMNEMAAKHRKPELPAIGICHYCSEAVPSSAKFCDNECADAHEREQDLLRKNRPG